MIQIYFQRLKHILSDPTDFFQTTRFQPGITEALSFAIVTHWIGRLFEFLWTSVIGIGIGKHLNRWLQEFQDSFGTYLLEESGKFGQLQSFPSWDHSKFDLLANWFFGFGTVIADPFLTAIKVLLYASVVYLGANLFVPKKFTYETAVRVVGFGMAPAVLAGIPLLGGLIAWSYGLIITVLAARELYRINTGRAIVVGLFPQITSFFMICFVLFFAVAIVVGVMA